jgi:hypothetical protein
MHHAPSYLSSLAGHFYSAKIAVLAISTRNRCVGCCYLVGPAAEIQSAIPSLSQLSYADTMKYIYKTPSAGH